MVTSRLRAVEQITCCPCEPIVSGLGETQLNDWYAKKVCMESWELFPAFRRQQAAVIITALCSVPLDESSTDHFY